ncbi:MAG TPA: hypothetical protein VKR82_17595 [Candidatus Acidoferrales bacterium]|nr:hypothetical protein [Candidatus Acidoferrales bacterium]
MNSYWVAVLVPALIQFLLFLRWLHRRLRDDELQRAFVRDMATNHLPHIYYALHHLAHKLQVDLPDPPPVHFVAFNGQSRERRERAPSDSGLR